MRIITESACGAGAAAEKACVSPAATPRLFLFSRDLFAFIANRWTHLLDLFFMHWLVSIV